MGFTIGCDSFGYGLIIPHYGTIVVGASNRIGNYAVLHTAICVSDKGADIGDGLYMGTGAKITARVSLGKGVSIAANSVVNKDFGDEILLVGMPATIKRQRKIWYDEEGGKYLERVTKVEQYRRNLLKKQYKKVYNLNNVQS